MNSADLEACVCWLVSSHCPLSTRPPPGGGWLRVPAGWWLSAGALPAQDLCERHEKGVLHKHQRALHKYSVTKRQMLSAAVQSREPDSAQPLESRIVEVLLAGGGGRGAGRPGAAPRLGCL